jgi:hypothetical protein
MDNRTRVHGKNVGLSSGELQKEERGSTMKLQERERETGKTKGKGEKGENKWAKNQTLKKISVHRPIKLHQSEKKIAVNFISSPSHFFTVTPSR